MKAVRSLLFTIVALIGFSFVAAPVMRAQSFVSPAPPRTVDEQIYRKLKYLPNANVFDHIAWEVNGSTVTLAGKVYTLGTRDAAAARVRDVPGITMVVNNLVQLPPSPMDDRIRIAALREFTQRGPAQYFSEQAPDVRIIVENGRLTLEGNVLRNGEKNTLNVLANTIPGVFRVTNNIVVGERTF